MDQIVKIKAKMQKEGITALVISDPMSIFYLTGIYHDPHERLYALIISAKESLNSAFKDSLLIAPKLSETEISKNLTGINAVYFGDDEPYLDIIPNYLSELKAKLNADNAESDELALIGLDKNFKARFLVPLMEKYKANYIIGSHLIDNARMIKSEIEIAKMKQASLLNDEMMRQIVQFLNTSIGITEVDAVKKLGEILLAIGGDGYSFEPIICFGKGTAEPHHTTDMTRLEVGMPVLIDIGLIKDGYCADMTRSYMMTETGLINKDFGQTHKEYQKIYDIVKSAVERGKAVVKVGGKMKDIDIAVREYITAQGYGEYFTHRTGHGIGMETHEYPDVSSVSETEIQEGMIFSIEPGIYLPSGIGIRLEDLVLVEKTGAYSLNKLEM